MRTQPVVIRGKIRLQDFDPRDCAGLDKKDTNRLVDKCGRRIGELQELLYANSDHAVVLLFQGMDASGKDGAVRGVLRHVNPTGIEVANFKVPSAEESAHDFLWRVHQAVPRYGNIGVFNRSHYEAVLAERVLEIVPRNRPNGSASAWPTRRNTGSSRTPTSRPASTGTITSSPTRTC